MKELDRQEEELERVTQKEIDDNHEVWESRKVTRRAQDMKEDLRKTGKHGKRSKDSRDPEPGFRRAKKLKYSLMEDDWGESGSLTRKREHLETEEEDKAYPKETGREEDTPVEEIQELCSSNPILQPCTHPINLDSLQESVITGVMEEGIHHPVPSIGTKVPDVQEPRRSTDVPNESRVEEQDNPIDVLMGGGPQLLNPMEDNEYDITEDKNQGYSPNTEDTAQDTIEHPVDMLPSVDSTGNQTMSKD